MATEDGDVSLFVGNITYMTRERELEELFSKYGKVKDVRIAVESGTGRSRGYAFLVMEGEEAAKEAIREITGVNVDGREIRVEISTGGKGKERDRHGDRDRDRHGDRDRDRRYNGGGRDYGRDRDRRDRSSDRGRDRDRDRRDRSYDRHRDRDSRDRRDRRDRHDRSRDRY
eukprot:gene5123-7137_t